MAQFDVKDVQLRSQVVPYLLGKSRQVRKTGLLRTQPVTRPVRMQEIPNTERSTETQSFLFYRFKSPVEVNMKFMQEVVELFSNF